MSFEEVNPEYYDFIILGTGLTETALSYILSKNKALKILHIDKNSTYGNEFATYQYHQLEDHFGGSNTLIDSLLSRDKEFNIDLTPKLLLQDSKLKDFLLDNQIEDMVLFGPIKGSYVYTDKLHSIPTSEVDALKSSVLSFKEKYKVVKFFYNIRKIFNNSLNPMKTTMLEEFKSFGLKDETIEYIGHAIALNLNDDYLYQHPQLTYDRIVQYVSSIVSYESTKSPYIYPIYGLSELCQAFARKSAINGTTFMLNADITAIKENKINLIDPNGTRHRYISKKIIADPRYFANSLVEKEIIRCIFIIPRGSFESRNIIYLKSYLGRKNDIFCVILTHEESVCPKEYEVGIISTVKETDDPYREVEPLLKKFCVIKFFIETRKIFKNFDTENVIFIKNVDESPIMDNIYKDMEDIVHKLNIDMDVQPIDMGSNK